MIPFNLLPMMRPATRPVFSGLTSGSLLESRRAGFRTRLAPDTLARLFTLQPVRLLIAAALLVALTIGTTAVSIRTVDQTPAESASTDQAISPALDRVDTLDMSRWQF